MTLQVEPFFLQQLQFVQFMTVLTDPGLAYNDTLYWKERNTPPKLLLQDANTTESVWYMTAYHDCYSGRCTACTQPATNFYFMRTVYRLYGSMTAKAEFLQSV